MNSKFKFRIEVVKETSEFSNSQSDGVSKYVMVGKTGKKTYFADDGRVLGIVDRYGNTIKFEYTTVTYSIDGNVKNRRLVSKITDTVGRVVTLEYKEDSSFTVGPIDNTKYPKEESYKETQNPNTTDSGDLKGKFQIIVNVPGNKSLIYDKSAVLVSSTKHIVRTRLQRVYDFDGKVRFHYWYEQPDLGFTYKNGTKYSAYNRYENLVQIDYCRTNKIKRYTYNTYTKSLDEGSMQYRKVFEQKDLSKTGYDLSQTKFIDRFVCDTKNKTVYQYKNEADGFGYLGYEETNETYLKNTYRYYTDITDMSGTVTKYTFDGAHQTVRIEEVGKNHKKVTLTEHDEMKFPKKKEYILSSLENGQVIGQQVKKIENYRYDEYGNLTNYTGPYANRDDKGYPVDTENTVTYTYSYDKFHVPTSKTWKQDKNTTSQIIYEADSKGNILKETKIHTENAKDNNIITNYQYDNYGNMTKKTIVSSDNQYITNYEYRVDADGEDCKGAYLTKEYSIIKGLESAKKYAYNFNTGTIKAEIDQRGNRTSYEYDVLERTTKITYANNTSNQYLYNDNVFSNSQIQFTNQNGAKFLYEIDSMDNWVKNSIFTNDKWSALEETEYDYKGNKTKETDSNGNTIKYEYNSEDMPTKKTYFDKNGTTKESIVLTYTYGIDNNTPLFITSTDEDGYTSKMYFDILDRLTTLEVTPDKKNYFKSTYVYDYTGNKLSETDFKNNQTNYQYDDLGRLVKKTDALNNETLYKYNAKDEILTIEEPGNKIIQKKYDVLGRITEERIQLKNSSNYSYKNYEYDLFGNLRIQKEGKYEASVDYPSSYVESVYDNMNKIEDKYVKIDDTSKSHIKYTYDGIGNVKDTLEFVDDSEKKYLLKNYNYDFEGRVTQEEGQYKDDENKATYGYYLKKLTRDLEGNILKVEEFNGKDFDVTLNEYDYGNRIISKIEPYTKQGETKKTIYTYDKKGNLASETTTINGTECVTSYQYNGIGKLIKKIDALGNISRFIYDANGNLLKEIDPRYASYDENTAPGIEYEYDVLNRQVKTLVNDGTVKTVLSYKEYDNRGNLSKEVSGEGYNSTEPSKSIGNIYV